MKYYFIIINDEQLGPLTFEELGKVGLNADTPVWNEGLPDWTPAGNLPELKPIITVAGEASSGGERNAGYQGSQPPAWTGTSSALPPSTAVQQPRRSHTGWWIAAAIIAVLVVAMAVTCPDRKAHERAIAGVTKEWMGDKLDQWGADGVIGSMFRMLGGMGTDYAIDQMLDVDDYFLYSVGYITMGEERSKASFGIMGHVFTFNKEHIDEAFNQWIGITGGNNDEKPSPAPLPPANEETDDGDDANTGDAPEVAPQDERSPVDNLVDTITGSLKREGKEWLKRLIDSL